MFLAEKIKKAAYNALVETEIIDDRFVLVTVLQVTGLFVHYITKLLINLLKIYGYAPAAATPKYTSR